MKELLKAWHAARCEMAKAGKGGFNEFDRYNYATEEDWHDTIMPHLLNHGLILVFSQDECIELPPRTTKKGGTEYAVEVKMTATLFHAESGESHLIQGWGHGQDRADKALYKALTGCKKYLWSSLMALPTSDDPERDETVGLTPGNGASPPPAQPAKPSWEMVKGGVVDQLMENEKDLLRDWWGLTHTDPPTMKTMGDALDGFLDHFADRAADVQTLLPSTVAELQREVSSA